MESIMLWYSPALESNQYCITLFLHNMNPPRIIINNFHMVHIDQGVVVIREGSVGAELAVE